MDDGETIIIDMLSAETVNKMVAEIKMARDIQEYLEYKEIIWHYKIKFQEHESLCLNAEHDYQAASSERQSIWYFEGFSHPCVSSIKGRK
jgi:hypothetical protein